MRIGLAFRSFFRILSDAGFADKVAEAAIVKALPKPRDDLRVLGLLQRDGRLVDFLLEDVAGYSDDQIGAAVRDIHRDCRKCIDKYFQFSPVLDVAEDSKFTVEPGFDANSIRLTGAVKGAGPYRGTVVHRGWRVTESKLPEVPPNADSWTIAPAEVEIA